MPRKPAIEGKRVLTYCKYGRMRDRALDTLPSGVVVFRPDGMKPGKDIQYWMPIPDAPEVEK